MDNQLEWQKVRSEPGPDLGILSVRFDWLKHPTEDRTLKRLVLESGDWINVVALTEDGKSVMVEQYRFGTGSCTIETPGGMVAAGETPLLAALPHPLRALPPRRARVQVRLCKRRLRTPL